MELRIVNRTAFLAHARLAERPICFERAIVMSTLDHILVRRLHGPVGCCDCGMDRHRRDRCQASSRESKTCYCFELNNSGLPASSEPALGLTSAKTALYRRSISPGLRDLAALILNLCGDAG